MVSPSGDRGFVTSPSRELATASKAELAVRERSACPYSATVTCPATRSSSYDRFWLCMTPPRAGLESFLDDELDAEKM